MTDYPQFPPPQQPPRPPHPGASYPGGQHRQPPYAGQPAHVYPGYAHPPSPAPEPPTPKKKPPRLRVGLAISGVLVLVALVAGLAVGTDSDTENTTNQATAPSLGAEPSQAEIDTDQVAKSEIIRDSVNFQHLSTPEWIMPGAKYVVAKKDGNLGFCSFGWMVRQPSAPEQIYNLTAGHCGDPGERVYLDPSGKQDPAGFVQIGQFIAQDYAGEQNIEDGADYALMQIDPAMNKYIRYTPDVTAGGKQKLDLVGTISPQELIKSKPYTCHLGWRSGLSCGPFREITSGTNMVFEGIADHGDSGGVVWSFDESDPNASRIYASGIVSWVEFDGDAAATNAKTIDQVLSESGLQLVKD